MQPTVDGLKVSSWVANHRDEINSQLLDYGAILFRGFNIKTVDEFEQFIRSLSGELLEYRYRSTSRHSVGNKIYTSTDYPPSDLLPLHCEMAYKREWPMKIFFFCIQPAQQGGETPIADNRKVSTQISTSIKDLFLKKKVRYVRNYGYAVDLSWQDAFQTTDKVEVEKYCRTADIHFEWGENDSLRTSQTCQAMAVPSQNEREGLV